MSELSALYQQLIVDHAKRPRNFHSIANPTSQAEGFNPLCGDQVIVYLVRENDTITNASFTGSGCAICTASASIMTQLLKGKTAEQVSGIFVIFRDLVMGKVEPLQVAESLEKLTGFAGVRDYPTRVKCATLPWHTMKAALDGKGQAITTE